MSYKKPSQSSESKSYLLNGRSLNIEHFQKEVAPLKPLEQTLAQAVSFFPSISPHEGFLALLIFRRKWVLKVHPDREAELRELFKGDQILIAKEVLHSDTRLMVNRLKRMLAQVLAPEFSKKILVKGRVFDAHELWKEHPYAFSLMATYEPRDILRATRLFLVGFVRKMLLEDYTDSEILNLDKEWQNQIHRTNRRGLPRFVLLDCETQAGYEETITRLQNHLGHQLEPILRYRCATPSGGIHVVLEITDNLREAVFKDKILQDLESSKEVEIKTGGFLTHLDVGLNPGVRTL